MRLSSGRLFPVLLVSALGLTLLAGCAQVPATAQLPDPAVTAPASIADQVLTTEGLPVSLVPGLETVIRSKEDQHLFFSWFSLPGESALGATQEALVGKIVDPFIAAEAPVPAGAAPELNVRPALTAVSERMLGTRISSYVFTGSSGGTSYHTQWFDLEQGTALESRGLFTGPAEWATFKSLVSELLAQNPWALADGLDTLDDVLLDSLNFDSAGNMLVEFDESSVAPAPAGTIVIKVPSGTVLPMLSEDGLAARSAGMNPVGIPSPTSHLPELPPGSAPGTPPVEARSVQKANCTKVKCVALTFDDGPGPKTTKVLDALKAADARATFFVVGPNAVARPRVLKRMAAEGHEIGNHTWNHRLLTSLDEKAIQNELDSTDTAISKAVGRGPTVTRPPYGAKNPTTNRLTRTPVVLWNVDTLDWKHRSTSKTVASALNDTRPGSIVLMHDIHPSTVAAVPAILAGLKKKGYHFVTVSELLESNHPKAGVAYSNGPAPKQKKPTKNKG
ncbi:polysaccharide deacetylase family protein [Paeniglutamicibacter cryotolerans]|uniref:Peptidoglycan/xylan/chitin deacetylase (PgdA/CDA1 family) n=1 Tax=Paeniglutamicibacter cryotolerans TaxID=670079 RepID=A0A839QM43_9MICC|nr:polysaccharide deacetylase family protein [Paeniglutamicibacter cryotolerans]MBB2994272.1 peptidoglycan/xylan/chitin deacetylase (PgdA/CDA1 family) [Paeniglutamicibacter cryotolerans]